MAYGWMFRREVLTYFVTGILFLSVWWSVEVCCCVELGSTPAGYFLVFFSFLFVVSAVCLFVAFFVVFYLFPGDPKFDEYCECLCYMTALLFVEWVLFVILMVFGGVW